MSFEHQDWNTVVLKKTHKPEPPKPISSEKKKFNKLDNAEEAAPIKKSTTEFKNAFQQARLANKLSQKELAQKINVPVAMIQQYESGKVAPTNLFISNMEKLLKTKLPRIK